MESSNLGIFENLLIFQLQSLMNLVLFQKVICFQIIGSRIQVDNCVLIRSINGETIQDL